MVIVNSPGLCGCVLKRAGWQHNIRAGGNGNGGAGSLFCHRIECDSIEA
jgi:hypothetical protein